jgi:hypothetical protein
LCTIREKTTNSKYGEAIKCPYRHVVVSKQRQTFFLTPHVLVTQAEIKMLKRENEKRWTKTKTYLLNVA